MVLTNALSLSKQLVFYEIYFNIFVCLSTYEFDGGSALSVE